MTLSRNACAFGALRAACFVAVTVSAGCNFDSSANAAHGCETCAPGMCYLGYCLQPATNLGASGSGGDSGSGGVGSGLVGVGEVAGDGASGTTVGLSGTGGSGAGGAPGSGGATGSCVPADETCNGIDDDCDGTTDEDVLLGSCAVPGAGPCGGVLACEGGAPVCHSSDQPAAEVCNGVDDDCDGQVDEQSDIACYADNTAGCTKNADGTFACVGACKQGTRECKNGTLGSCVAFVVPVPEVCGQTDPQDDDCNGKVDDTCPCQGAQTQSCYTGPAGTQGVGTCRAGTQTCSHGVFGPCEGSIVPVAETCENQGADDDCDYFPDDVPRVGWGCSVRANKGVCHDGYVACARGSLVCVTPNPAPAETTCDGLDENCNGQVDEVFDLNTDEHNCGACGTTCGAGQLCCAGKCIGTSADAHNCGACGTTCDANQLCCAGKCVGTNSDDHCGSCSACSAGNGCCNGACLPNGPGTCNACTACTGTLACCGGMCVDTTTNGRCGSCAMTCQSACMCVAGQCQDSGGMACPPPP